MAMYSQSHSQQRVSGFTTSLTNSSVTWEDLTLESDCFLEEFGGYGLTIASQEITPDAVEVLFTMESTQCAVSSAPALSLPAMSSLLL